MKTPLENINIKSIYKISGRQVNLPSRIAKCTPDTFVSIHNINDELKKIGSELVLSDLFRSYEMQYQANLDYVNGKKPAYSPPPGGSMHESGRAFDMDLKIIRDAGISLQQFWDIANQFGVYQIIRDPDYGAKEAWHFDCRGSHQKVYEYYSNGPGKNMKPYIAMAGSAILAIGVPVDRFKGKEQAVNIQFGLIRLGFELGNVDGVIGNKTKNALNNAEIEFTDLNTLENEVENKLQLMFPAEYLIIDDTHDEPNRPERIID